jgi:superfamily II DNA/RNA helicase
MLILMILILLLIVLLFVSYVNRIGRTGRGGASGTAITFFTKRDRFHAKRLVQLMVRLTIQARNRIRGNALHTVMKAACVLVCVVFGRF